MTDQQDARFRRIVYSSTATAPTDDDTQIDILRQSRANNGLNGISGILLSDGRRFLQVLEGTPEAIEHVFARISADPRHAEVKTLHSVSGNFDMIVIVAARLKLRNLPPRGSARSTCSTFIP